MRAPGIACLRRPEMGTTVRPTRAPISRRSGLEKDPVRRYPMVAKSDDAVVQLPGVITLSGEYECTRNDVWATLRRDSRSGTPGPGKPG
jgi:hypothetical protein